MVSTLRYSYDRFAYGTSADHGQTSQWLPFSWLQSAYQKCVRATTRAASPLNTDSLLVHKLTPALTTNPNVHQRNLAAASSALALSFVGLRVAPLRLVALPVLVYMGLPAARQLYHGLKEENAFIAVVETTALALLLAHGAILPGALAFSLYYLGRIWLAKQHDNDIDKGGKLLIPKSICVRRAEGDMIIDVEHVLPNEHIVYGSGDLIALNGTIIEGTAWIQNLTGSNALTENRAKVVKTNETVAIGSLVLAGILIVECG